MTIENTINYVKKIIKDTIIYNDLLKIEYTFPIIGKVEYTNQPNKDYIQGSGIYYLETKDLKTSSEYPKLRFDIKEYKSDYKILYIYLKNNSKYKLESPFKLIERSYFDVIKTETYNTKEYTNDIFSLSIHQKYFKYLTFDINLVMDIPYYYMIDPETNKQKEIIINESHYLDINFLLNDKVIFILKISPEVPFLTESKRFTSLLNIQRSESKFKDKLYIKNIVSKSIWGQWDKFTRLTNTSFPFYKYIDEQYPNVRFNIIDIYGKRLMDYITIAQKKEGLKTSFL